MASNYLAKGLKRSALTVALGLCFAGGVQAQSTTGGISGSAPAGSTVTISNNSGISRDIKVDASGHYTANSLPVGNYTVKSGANKRDLVVTVGSTANVSFGDGTGTATLGTVTVSGTNVRPIDVTSVDTRSIVTAAELQRLPLARSAEAIAMLAPGAVVGNGTFFGGEISFGGSSVAENAYYLNGYFSGNPMTNVGGFTLPYGSIEQQETYTGGYAAKYGRSAGGVISQIGKSGSNDWHFGGQVVYTPKALKEVRPDRYEPNLPLTGLYSYTNPGYVGLKYDSGKDRLSWSTAYSAYASGPIIKDKLFFFVSAEDTKGNNSTPGGNPAVGLQRFGTKDSSTDPKMYAKLNWNITSNHLLEYTYVAEKYKDTGNQYNFDWNTYAFGSVTNPSQRYTSNTEYSILRYTGYLTDTLTLSANYGKSRNRYNSLPFLTGHARIRGSGSENPSIDGGAPRSNGQSDYRAIVDADQKTDGLRVELEWVLGKHTLSGGIDYTNLSGKNQGSSQVADAWVYGKGGNSKTNLVSTLGVGSTGTVPGACNGAPNGLNAQGQPSANGSSANCGYNVYRLRYFDNTSMSNKQKAFYLEDKWQVTDNLLLSLGVRADTFQNFSDVGVKFVDSGTQWQPRLGFAWDVNGDSSFKVFGNAGRYFLNMPNAVAIRGVGASTYTKDYFTYTTIDADGTPRNLTPVNGVGGTPPPGPVSSNGELGTPKDPLTYVPKDIKSEYQDEYVLGFEHSLGGSWTLGTKLTDRVLKSAIDDFCDPNTLLTQAGLTSYAYDTPHAANIGQDTDGKLYAMSNCYMFNPGGSNTYSLQQVTPSGSTYANVAGVYKDVKVSSKALGFPALKRNYTALDFFLERKWDGKWEARIDYTFSKSFGNNEGPANSDTGQGNDPHDNGVATSQNWDAYQIMAYSAGYLPNDRRHQLKAHGSYAITPDWTVSGNLRIASGAPKSCFGYYDPNGTILHDSSAADPIGYGSSYHTCFGQTYTPGKETSPWTQRLDLGVTWKPSVLQHKLALNMNVINVFNQRTPTSYQSTSEGDGPYSIQADYNLPIGYTTPRYVQFSLSYDY
jgi:outer membrane receptor for ferrienterochelin and colicin